MPELDVHDPRHHTRKMEQRFKETAEHLRTDVEAIDDPRAKALFETAAEVLNGLEKAFHDYDKRNEAAWS
jgi:hypothetical protein